MRKPIPIPAQRVKELEAFRTAKWQCEESRRFLYVWLRVDGKLRPAEIAGVLGWHLRTVRTTQQDFIKHGVDALSEKPRGRGHHSLLPFDEERALLGQFIAKAGYGSVLLVSEIHLALERRLGKRVAESTLTACRGVTDGANSYPGRHTPCANRRPPKPSKRGFAQVVHQAQERAGTRRPPLTVMFQDEPRIGRMNDPKASGGRASALRIRCPIKVSSGTRLSGAATGSSTARVCRTGGRAFRGATSLASRRPTR